MNDKLKSIWHDPVWSKVIATAIITILGFVVTVGWNWLGGGKTIQDSLKLVFEYKVNLWLVLAVLILILIVIGLIIRNKQNKNQAPITPFLTGFTEGFYQGQRWKWHWQWSPIYKFYYVTDLNIECPVCHKGLLTLEYMNYRCAKCNSEIPYEMLNTTNDTVAKQILEDARKQYDYCAEYIGKLPSGFVKA